MHLFTKKCLPDLNRDIGGPQACGLSRRSHVEDQLPLAKIKAVLDLVDAIDLGKAHFHHIRCGNELLLVLMGELILDINTKTDEAC